MVRSCTGVSARVAQGASQSDAMVVEVVIAEPWVLMACLSCGEVLSIPALGPSRNRAPVLCPYCAGWFAYRPPENLRKRRRSWLRA